MKISLNWLKDYVDLKDISVEEIVAHLTMSGLEVEDVLDQNKLYKNFIVGLVKEKEKRDNERIIRCCYCRKKILWLCIIDK